jgi:hypothetical protein
MQYTSVCLEWETGAEDIGLFPEGAIFVLNLYRDPSHASW